MKLKNGRNIDRYVKDSNGPKGFIFWIQDSYCPPMIFVRGESWEDAYAWFICDEWVEKQLQPDEADMKAEFSTPELYEKALENGTLTMNDNGTVLWGENEIYSESLKGYMRSD